MALSASFSGHPVLRVTPPSRLRLVCLAYAQYLEIILTFPDAMTMSQYLGRGSVSRGRTTITKRLDMTVSVQPFLHNDFDKEAVIKGIENLQAALSNVPNLTWIVPPPNVTASDYVNKLIVTANGRRSNHWMGKYTTPALQPFQHKTNKDQALTNSALMMVAWAVLMSSISTPRSTEPTTSSSSTHPSSRASQPAIPPP